MGARQPSQIGHLREAQLSHRRDGTRIRSEPWRTRPPVGVRAANGNFAQQAEEVGQRAMEQLEELREQAGEMGERVVAFIKERPGTSLLIAAAAGYLIGRIVRS